MSATTISRSGVGEGPEGWSDARSIAERLVLPAILVLAAANFFWQLGSSSYFIDEAFSVMHSLPAIHTLLDRVAHTETTPYTYFLFLHEWMIRAGSQAEWVTRLPSAVAGVGVIGAVYWMAGAFVGRAVALGAAALCAISPLIQSYAQETRVYIFLILALVLSVGATVRACQQPERRTVLLTLGAVMAFLAIWLHYTAVGVIAPLAVWLGTRSELSRRARVAFIAVCVVGVGTVMPLLVEQYSIFPNGGAINGAINWNNAVSVIGTPFGARVGTPLDARTVTGAIVVLVSLAVLLRRRRRPVAERGLLVAIASVGILGIFFLDLLGK
jgi:4-amino-4-deoxy-L-arabinose transferase-like glycosyltransferase